MKTPAPFDPLLRFAEIDRGTSSLGVEDAFKIALISKAPKST
jgi:hypothetical protein